MDRETELLLDTIAERAAREAVAKSREFHQDDLKVLGERMDIGFEKIDRDLKEITSRLDSVEVRLGNVEVRLGNVEVRLDNVEVRLDGIDQRFDRVENALATLLEEFKTNREKQKQLEAQVAVLTERVRVLELQLAHQ